MSTETIIEKIFIPLVAAFVGAILAFIYQKRMQMSLDKKQVFATLMAYRNMGTYEEDFVKALNLVVVVFYQHEKVKDAFHKYLTAIRNIDYSKGQILDCVFHLLSEMSLACGYKNLKHSDIKDFVLQNYFPKHKDDEAD